MSDSATATASADDGSSNEDERLPVDAIFDALNSARRRFVVCYLDGREGAVDLNELAAELAGWETNTPREEVTDTQQRRVYISLYQTHIPKLEQYRVVAYDADARTVERQPRAVDLLRHLQRGTEPDGADVDASRDTWWQYYLVAGVAGLVGAAGTALLRPAWAVAVGAALAVLVIGLALAQWRAGRQDEDSERERPPCDPRALERPEQDDGE